MQLEWLGRAADGTLQLVLQRRMVALQLQLAEMPYVALPDQATITTRQSRKLRLPQGGQLQVSCKFEALKTSTASMHHAMLARQMVLGHCISS